MKKLGSLISGVLTVAFLTGCGSQTAATFAPIQNTPDTGVSVQSTQGLKSFYTILTEKEFVMLDTNKDKSISFDEFKARQLHIGFGYSTTPVNPQPEPVTTQVESVNPPSDATTPSSPAVVAKPVAPMDPLQTFLKIDKNKNGKITLAEAKASKYFLGVSQLELRNNIKPLFDNFDTDKNKSVSKAEFLKAISGMDTNMQQSMLSLFNTGDRNFNNSLTFSEFEDMLYASIKAMWEVPMTPAPVPVQPDPNPPQPITPTSDPGQPVPAN